MPANKKKHLSSILYWFMSWKTLENWFNRLLFIIGYPVPMLPLFAKPGVSVKIKLFDSEGNKS